MPTLHIALTDDQMAHLRAIADQYGLRSHLGSHPGEPSVSELLKALADGRRFDAASAFEWPESCEIITREDWDHWWGLHFPPPEKGTPSYKNWRVLKNRRWADFTYRRALEDTAHFGSWLSEVEGLQEMLLVLARWFRMRRRLRRR